VSFTTAARTVTAAPTTWEKVEADIFSFARKDYSLVVDYYSEYPEIALLEDKTATSAFLHLKSI
jgi:hypothetical protein